MLIRLKPELWGKYKKTCNTRAKERGAINNFCSSVSCPKLTLVCVKHPVDVLEDENSLLSRQEKGIPHMTQFAHEYTAYVEDCASVPDTYACVVLQGVGESFNNLSVSSRISGNRRFT